jgi:hypothetical protein
MNSFDSSLLQTYTSSELCGRGNPHFRNHERKNSIMRRRLILASLFVASSALLTPAYAQCPGGTSNPLKAIAGTWSFQLHGPSASIGRFTIDPNAPGYVAITETTASEFTGVTQLGQYQGKYSVLPDCSGGTIMLGPEGVNFINGRGFFGAGNSNRNYAFFVGSGFSEITLVSIDDMLGATMGTAVLVTTGAAQCPAGTLNPLNVLTGAWFYGMTGAAGRFVASPATVFGVTQGFVTATETSNGPAVLGGNRLIQLATYQGKYQVLPDCSGGTVMLGTAGLPNSLRNYAFVFGPNFAEMFLVSLDNVEFSPNLELFVYGTAKKF